MIKDFLQELNEKRIHLHAFRLYKGDRLICDTYAAPYEKDRPHRLFSVAKSFAAIAIGLLYSEGRINPEDKISGHFPQYCDKNAWDRFKTECFEKLTIRNMLMMKTCHTGSTFKIGGCDNYTESFFKAPVHHLPDSYFSYDTASAQVLGALAEIISGEDYLTYIKKKLPVLSLSDSSYIMKSPEGYSMGGSGLVGYIQDLSGLGLLLRDVKTLSSGEFSQKYGTAPLFYDFMTDATANLSATFHTAKSRQESFGYGYMFWQTDCEGVMAYGLGGQYSVYYPKEDLTFCTLCDNLGRAEGNDAVFDAFYRHILPFYDKLTPVSDIKLSLPAASPVIPVKITPFNRKYKALSPGPGFDTIEVGFDNEKGHLILSGVKRFTIDFAARGYLEGCFDGYDMYYCANGYFINPDTLCIKVKIIDTSLGNLSFTMHFSPDKESVCMFMKKNEESMFNEFTGDWSGSHIPALQ